MEGQEATTSLRMPTPDHGPTDVSNPLLGVVLCCTSVPPEKRTLLADQAQQMGAQHKYDLTSEVTHLIVGDYDTPKYRYVAKERADVKVLTADWVEAVRELWIADKPIDVEALETAHRMPTFASLRICLTGFEDPTERAEIAELVRANGAEYHGDLTKNVTHLIASRPEGSKYKHAKIWGLRIVSLEWVTDSIERGMILDETLYNPEMPAEQRGKDSWRRVVRSPLGKRRHDGVPVLEEGRRKLRRTTSSKLASQNEKIWGDIVGGTSVIQAAASGVWETAEDLQNNNNDSTMVDGRGESAVAVEQPTRPHHTATRRTFSDCRFYIDGFDAKKFQVLQSHLTSHDGEISMTPAEFVSPSRKSLFLLVPHSVPETKLPDLPDCDTHIQTVTEWWVERCLGVNSFVDPSEYTFGRPFPKYPLPRFSDLTICSTGFDGTQLLHLSKAVALVGAKYDEFFSKNASVLIVNPERATRREKLITAQECGIPVVSLDWLLDSIESGSRQRYQQYLQRSKKPKLDFGIAPLVDEDLVRPQRQGKPFVKPDPDTSSFSQSRSSGKAPTLSKLDSTAFQDDQSATLHIKPDSFSDNTVSTATTEPLTAISPNSPRKPPSPSKNDEASQVIPDEVITTTMASLLAATKSKPVQSENANEPSTSAARKKRAPSRILGRAASIASNSGTSLSRASSVDSTASTGAAVIWPKKPNNNTTTDRNTGRSNSPAATNSDPSLDMNMKSMINGGGEDSQPQQTQMQYDDVESNEYKARVMAKMTGEKVIKREVARVATVASLKETAREPRKSRLRDRMGGAGSMR